MQRKQMKVKYSAHKRHSNSGDNYDERPLLHVRLRNGANIIDVDGLVDSGATDCVFTHDLADALDIDLTDSPMKEYEAIGGSVIQAYKHNVKLQVVGFDEWITINAGFINHDEMPILGHSGFFDSYAITFRSYNHQFEITRKKAKTRPHPRTLRK